jgi:hypothetical protein
MITPFFYFIRNPANADFIIALQAAVAFHIRTNDGGNFAFSCLCLGCHFDAFLFTTVHTMNRELFMGFGEPVRLASPLKFLGWKVVLEIAQAGRLESVNEDRVDPVDPV